MRGSSESVRENILIAFRQRFAPVRNVVTVEPITTNGEFKYQRVGFLDRAYHAPPLVLPHLALGKMGKKARHLMEEALSAPNEECGGLPWASHACRCGYGGVRRPRLRRAVSDAACARSCFSPSWVVGRHRGVVVAEREARLVVRATGVDPGYRHGICNHVVHLVAPPVHLLIVRERDKHEPLIVRVWSIGRDSEG